VRKVMPWLLAGLFIALIVVYGPMLTEQHDRQYGRPSPTAGCSR
jgi:hypothetical protein